jgi:hypothetical protein
MAGETELEDLTTTGTSAGDEPVDEAASDEEAVSLEGIEPDDELPPAPDPDAEPEPDGPPAPPDGVTVDEKGRWRTADGKFASKQPTPEAAASVQAEVAAQAAEAPKADPITPWKPNIYGQEVELIPGAKFHPDHGLLIPKDQIPNATALMARGTKYGETQEARQKFAQEREQIVGAAKYENELMGSILNTTVLNAEWVLQAATDPQWAEREIKTMLREANLALKEKYGSSALAQPAAAEAKPQNDPGELDPYDAELGLRGWINETLNTPEYHGLFKDSERDAMVRRLMTITPFAKHEGKWALDTLVAQQFIDALAEAPRREQAWRAEQEKKQAADAAAKRNANAVPKPTATPKPAAPAKKSAKSPPDYTEKPWLDPSLSREEKREALMRSTIGKRK